MRTECPQSAVGRADKAQSYERATHWAGTDTRRYAHHTQLPQSVNLYSNSTLQQGTN